MKTSSPGFRITSSKSRLVISTSARARGSGARRCIDEAVNLRKLAALENPPARVVPENVTRLKKKNKNAARYRSAVFSSLACKKYFLIFSESFPKFVRNSSRSRISRSQVLSFCTARQNAKSSLNLSFIQYELANFVDFA